MKLHVVKSEVLEAATNLQRALDNFTDATNDCYKAAEQLTNNWEGDRQKAFVAEEANNQELFKQMAKSVSNFITALKKAEDSYGDVDTECARLLKSK